MAMWRRSQSRCHRGRSDDSDLVSGPVRFRAPRGITSRGVFLARTFSHQAATVARFAHLLLAIRPGQNDTHARQRYHEQLRGWIVRPSGAASYEIWLSRAVLQEACCCADFVEANDSTQPWPQSPPRLGLA